MLHLLKPKKMQENEVNQDQDVVKDRPKTFEDHRHAIAAVAAGSIRRQGVGFRLTYAKGQQQPAQIEADIKALNAIDYEASIVGTQKNKSLYVPLFLSKYPA